MSPRLPFSLFGFGEGGCFFLIGGEIGLTRMLSCGLPSYSTWPRINSISLPFQGPDSPP
jgi:hypothetical protein